MEVTNDELIQAVFKAEPARKSRALLILLGEELPVENNYPLLLRMGEAAELLNVSRATLWRTVRAGRLEKVELYPGSYRLRRADVIALAGHSPDLCHNVAGSFHKQQERAHV